MCHTFKQVNICFVIFKVKVTLTPLKYGDSRNTQRIHCGGPLTTLRGMCSFLDCIPLHV